MKPYRDGLIWRWRPTEKGGRGGRRSLPAECGTERRYQQHRYEARKGIGVWPLPADDPCGCRAAHRAHEAFRAEKERAA